jgi:hypothetical protein
MRGFPAHFSSPGKTPSIATDNSAAASKPELPKPLRPA